MNPMHREIGRSAGLHLQELSTLGQQLAHPVFCLPGRTSRCSPVILLQTLAKRVQPLIEPSRIVPEHPVPHIGH